MNVLVTYATMAGSTAEVAKEVRDTLANQGLNVDLKPIEAVDHLEVYDAIVVGGPMILGWHREARRFLRKNRRALEELPFAVFTLAMSLTDTGINELDGTPIFIDEKLIKPPEQANKLSIRERYASVRNYARPILRSAGSRRPISIAFFGGRLNYGRLQWWAVILAMLLVRGQAGDRRNWDAIRRWTRGLAEQLRTDAQAY
jgi:menaquinone-dependent protoporphyrinogen oxidase